MSLFDDATLREFSECYLPLERNRREGTVVEYCKDLGKYRAFLRRTGLPPAATATVRAWMATFGEVRDGGDEDPARRSKGRLSARTIRRRLATLGSYFKFLFCTDRITREEDPTLKIGRPQAGDATPRYFTAAQLERLLAVPDRDAAKGRRDFALLCFFVYTGARIDEAHRCAVEDVDLESGRVLLHGKGGRDRWVPVALPLATAMQRHLDDRPEAQKRSPLFPSCTKTINRRLLAACAEAGLPLYTAHALRHSCATLLFSKKAPLVSISRILGHRSVQTTGDVYVHTDTADLEEAVGMMPDLAAPPSGDAQAAERALARAVACNCV